MFYSGTISKDILMLLKLVLLYYYIGKLGVSWSAHKVELALWSYTIANQLNPHLIIGNHDNDTSDCYSDDSEETTPPKTKKQKVKHK